MEVEGKEEGRGEVRREEFLAQIYSIRISEGEVQESVLTNILSDSKIGKTLA